MGGMPAEPTAREKVFEGVRFDVVRVEFPRRAPSGGGGRGTMSREVVVPRDAVVILPLLDRQPGSEKIVLIRNERPAIGQTLWELPAGTIEEGEDPHVCAERELIEETGYEAERIERLASFYSSPGFCTEELTAFVAHGLTHVGQDLDDTENIDVEVVTFAEALAMAKDNRIRDAKSLATLLHYHAFGRESR